MPYLASRLSVAALAWDSVAAVCAAIGDSRADIAALDHARIAAAYRSDRLLLLDDEPPQVWSALSGFWRTADGWVRTHANYPHHAAALRAALSVRGEGEADAIAHVLLSMTSAHAIEVIARSGGLAVEVRREDPLLDARLRRTPLVESCFLGSAVPRPALEEAAPLAGIRVLDLTRVIAGPVCTRTLALLGADVLRIDPPSLPEHEWQHMDTGHGKRSALLDADSAAFADLLAGADVIVLGYRPAALARHGLSPEAIALRHPGIVIAQLSAWGTGHPDRGGFDSLVQAESGIAMIESSDGTRPGALPAQALDHSAGYRLAAGVITALNAQRRDGGTRLVRASLRRVAAELLGMPRHEGGGEEQPIVASDHTQEFCVDGRCVTTARSAVPGFEFAAPRSWGRDTPEW
ncbi:CoA transferase [Microbacterium sp. NPDC055903]